MMEIQEFISRLEEVVYPSFSSESGATPEELTAFSLRYVKFFGETPDKSFLDLLSVVNGFDLNGLSFYGTDAKSERYVQGFFKKNEFWSSELKGLGKRAIIADGDMEFYCIDLESGKYQVLSKGGLDLLVDLSHFEDLLSEINSSYM